MENSKSELRVLRGTVIAGLTRKLVVLFYFFEDIKREVLLWNPVADSLQSVLEYWGRMALTDY